jgi:predicted nucleic acid-binding protein
VNRRGRARLFLDSNVITGGIVAPWGLDKAVMSLCAAKICRLVLAAVVRDEVEANLKRHVAAHDKESGEWLLYSYGKLMRLAHPEIVHRPAQSAVIAARHLIRHATDVPVLLSAMNSQPDWLPTNNTRHLSQDVARRTGLRIATPAAFFRALSYR